MAFYVRGDDLGDDSYLGILKISGEDIMNDPENPLNWRILSFDGELPFDREEDWFPLVDQDGALNGAFMKITIKFKVPHQLKQRTGLIDSYFPVRHHCALTLYQDAETPANDLHDSITHADGSTYVAANAWRDIFEAISNAQHFIYLTGWSVWTDLTLLRDEGEDSVKLGDLLLQKSEEGVRVLGLVWDEKASTDMTAGLMGTHDEETEQFFR